MDRKVWNEFSADRGKLRHLARLIRLGVKLTETKGGTEDDVEFVEGRVLTELHKRRERNPRIRKLLIESRRKRGRLTCEMCLAPPDIDDPRFEDAIFEAHHIVPIAEAKERTTRLVDLSLLCANCHRLIHRAIAHHKMWLSIEECRTALGLASPSLE
jgi:5-methylcytosine-specific restriction protein A